MEVRQGEEKEETFMNHEKQHRECGCDVDDVEEDKDKGIGLNNKTLVAKELTDWDL